MRVRRPRLGRGALVVLAITLAASGALRLGNGVGAALARLPDATDPAGGPLACPEPPEALAAALRARAAQVEAQEAALADRMAALALADRSLSQRLTDLRAAEEELSATLALADGAAEADLSRLTAVYETMKPKDAALLFEAMAPSFAAGCLGRMLPEAAAAVLSGMSPDAAYAISVLLAGRNADVPKQ